MKILHLTHNDKEGGAGIAATRIHHALLDQRIDSKILVAEKKTSDSRIIVHTPSIKRKIINKLFFWNDQFIMNRYPSRNGNISTQKRSIISEKDINILNADVINLHWISMGFLSIKKLKKIGANNKPIVWTLHDSFAMTGGCHIKFQCTHFTNQCGRCPLLNSTNSKDITNTNWKNKSKAYENLNLTIVTPSIWLANNARESSLLRNKKIITINNPIDTTQFYPIDKKVAKQAVGLDVNKKYISFGAVLGSGPTHKGYKYLLEALKYLKEWNVEIEILVFGSQKGDETDLSFPIHYLGHINDTIALNIIYNASDAYVTPSLADNFPNTVLESMACGTPVAAFNTDGIPEQVDHLETGYIAEQMNSEDLAKGIRYCIDIENNIRLGAKSREKVLNNYTPDIISKKYIALYHELLNM